VVPSLLPLLPLVPPEAIHGMQAAPSKTGTPSDAQRTLDHNGIDPIYLNLDLRRLVSYRIPSGPVGMLRSVT